MESIFKETFKTMIKCGYIDPTEARTNPTYFTLSIIGYLHARARNQKTVKTLG